MFQHYFAKWNFSVQEWNLNAIYFNVFPTHTFVPNDDFDKWNLVIKFILANEMGRHIVFSSVVCLSVRPSVRLSVRPSHFRVRSISFEPLVGFSNNFAQISRMMRRCAVPRFDQGRFKVTI